MGVVALGFGAHRRGGLDHAIGHRDRPWLAVEFEIDLDVAFIIGLGNGLHADLKGLARRDFSRDFLALLHAIEESLGWQGAHRTIGTVATHIVEEHLGIHQIAIEILIINLEAFQLLGQFLAHIFQLDRWQMLARTLGIGLLALEHLVDDILREAAFRLPQIAAHHVDDGIRERQIHGGVFHLFAGQSPGETIISAISPTTLEDGVTFGISPNIRFTSA